MAYQLERKFRQGLVHNIVYQFKPKLKPHSKPDGTTRRVFCCYMPRHIEEGTSELSNNRFLTKQVRNDG